MNQSSKPFQQVHEAYSVLIDVEKRKKYDESLSRSKIGPTINHVPKATSTNVQRTNYAPNYIKTRSRIAKEEILISDFIKAHGLGFRILRVHDYGHFHEADFVGPDGNFFSHRSHKDTCK